MLPDGQLQAFFIKVGILLKLSAADFMFTQDLKQFKDTLGEDLIESDRVSETSP